MNYGYGNSNWKDQLTSYNGTAISYDASGNPLNWRNGYTLSWTGRQLDQLNVGNTQITYKYNADGLRISKSYGSEVYTYCWDGTTLLSQDHNGTTVVFLYNNGELIGFNYNGNNYYYGIDNLGVIRYVYNQSGTVVVTYYYDAWGKVLSVSGDMSVIAANPIRYKSYYYDGETGFYYLQSRYYDPAIGRFINADEVEYLSNHKVYRIFINLFCYCLNNSPNMVDQEGNDADYIYDQTDKKYSNLKYGFWGTIGSNGCGVVAAYNVLHSFSKKIKFNSVRKHFSFSSYYNMIGQIGVSPTSLISYLSSKFLFVYTRGPITTLWGITAEYSEAVIILYQNKGITSPLHYIAGIDTGKDQAGGSFRFYNCDFVESRNIYSVPRLLKTLKSKGCKPILLIGVAVKLGRW